MSAKDLPDRPSREEGWEGGHGAGGGEGERGPHGSLLRCELCGGPVLDRHCKLVCLNCGYQRDCSDP